MMRVAEKRSEKTNSWSVPGINGVECFRADAFVRQYPRHSHQTYSIGVIVGGVGGTIYRGSLQQIPPGSLVLINPDEPHTGFASKCKSLNYRMLYLEPQVIQQVMSDFRQPFYFKRLWSPNADLVRKLINLHSMLENSKILLAQQTELIETIEALSTQTELFGIAVQNSKEPKAVALIKEYLTDNYQQNISIDELTLITGLNRAYLIRLFRRTVGIPPYTWLLQVRIERAKQLLARGNSIVETALETGFADQSHLTRYFKNILGITPGQYVKGHYRSR